MIRVLVVDDSIFMRAALAKMLETDPEIRVIAAAKNGKDAIEKIRRHNPDVITMDVMMPGMDGLETLKVIQQDFSLPVIMVSSVTEEDAKETVEALSLGAFDFIPKRLNKAPVDILRIQNDLIAKVRAAYEARAKRSLASTLRKDSGAPPARPSFHAEKGALELVVIGASTGGPNAVQRIVAELPADFPVPIYVVIHMPPTFTRSYAERLNQLSMLHTQEAADGITLRPGHVYIARGGIHSHIRRTGDGLAVHLAPHPEDTLHRPSVDVTMLTAVQAVGPGVLGIVLTGMGKDGLAGMKEIHRVGGITLAQDEATSVVYGMPRVCIENQIVQKILPIDTMAEEILKIVRQRSCVSVSSQKSPP